MPSLKIEDTGGVRRVVLARPEVHNALNESLMRELTQAFRDCAGRSDIRVVVLSGEGPSFCAGADIASMRERGEGTFEENLQAGMVLAELFEAIDETPQPVVAVVHGAALGGGAGLVCAADIAIAHPATKIGFSEVRLGIVPAVIAPFVLRRLGRSEAVHLCLTGRRLEGLEAERRGLFHYLAEDPEEFLAGLLSELIKGSPQALATTKRLFDQLEEVEPSERAEWTARLTATARATADGQEGLRAFLEKRRPSWTVPS